MRKPCLLGIILLVATGCFAQAVPSNASQNSSGLPAGWRSGSTVDVYINTSAWGAPGSPMYNAIVNGATSMNAQSSWANVTLNFIPIDGYPVNPPGNYQVVVSSPDPNDDPNQEALNSYGVYSGPGAQVADVTYSIISINSALTNPDAVQHWMAHEEGHNFYLGDCAYCGLTNTIMDEFEVPWNTDGGLLGPTSSDTNAAGAYSDYGTFTDGGGDPIEGGNAFLGEGPQIHERVWTTGAGILGIGAIVMIFEKRRRKRN